MLKEVIMKPAMRLSEENLRRHTAECAQEVQESRQKRTEDEENTKIEPAICNWSFDDLDITEDGNIHITKPDLDNEAASQRCTADKGSRLPETPLERFVKLHPLHDSHPWVARCAFREMGALPGDMEAVDFRRLAYEMQHVGLSREEFQERDVGSLRASSDTLSVSRYHEEGRARGEELIDQGRRGQDRERL